MTEFRPESLLGSADYDEINVFDVLGLFLKHRWEILLCIALGLMSGFIYNLYATKIYHAKSSVVIQMFYRTGVIREKEAKVDDHITTMFDFNTKVSMIRSFPTGVELTRRLIDRGYFKERLEAMNFATRPAEQQEMIIQRMARGVIGGVNVDVPRMTNIVEMIYTSSDPLLARDAVNILAEIVVEQHRQQQLMIIEEKASILNTQLEDARKRLEEAEAKLYQYRLEHDIFETYLDKQSLAGQRTDMIRQLNNIKDDRKAVESSLVQLESILKKNDFTKYTPVITADITITNLNQDLVVTEVKYNELLLSYDYKHPEVIKYRERVRMLKQKMTEELIKTRTRFEFNLNVLKAREELIQGMLDEIEEAGVLSTEKDIDYVVLDREATSARDHYRTLLAAVKEISINSNEILDNVVYVYERAITPRAPIKPKKSLNMLIALFAGIFLGTAYVVAREFLDQTIKGPDDIKKTTNLPVLSTVPLFVNRPEESQTSPIMVSIRPKSLFSESITALRTHLNIKLPQDKPTAILVTSSAPREGKSLISANLATSMALDGKKTILIDADLHRPSIHKLFGQERGLGLYDLVVEALNPQWADVDSTQMSFGDMLHMIRLKQWSGTMKIQWDGLPDPLTIAYKDGMAAASNIDSWKDKYAQPSGFPRPQNPSYTLDETEVMDMEGSPDSGRNALKFIGQYPRLIRSSYFGEQAIRNYVKESDVKNLHILTAGSSTKNPGEILGSDQMKMLIGLLKEQYHRVVVDTPPAWPLSDVSLLSPSLDGVLWICRAGEIPKNVFQRTVNQIQQIQTNIIGVVINALDLSSSRYYGYSSYYHYYRYSYYHYYSSYGEDGQKNK